MTFIRPIRVFVDTDVIISSLISKSGAAFALISHTEQVKLYISNYSVLEFNKVVDRLHLQQEVLHNVIKNQLTSVKIDQTYKKVQIRFADYVRDPDDAHVAAGAMEAKASFLVSYNVRHFNAEKLRQDFQIILLTPGLFLQYLRSL
ncbi:MAG TPA: putative toxin-antitoxin system toxin component, PIN family [Candidatus Saccharimonadales bacterium]|nr:putative toxin-antitoxin system toxin component, PIN family [Candidatus Saccharimonadales bacterium]